MIRSLVSAAILAQCFSRCFAVVSAMAMSKASATAEVASVASATAERCFTAEMIRAHAGMSPEQPWHRSNEALKHFRDRMESCLQPRPFEMVLDLDPATFQVRKCIHDSGAAFQFSRGNDTVPFSWSRMLLATGRSFDEVVGMGELAVMMSARQNSYDNKRSDAFRRQQGLPFTIHAPVWDFKVMRVDGTGVLLHPRWRRTGGIEIVPFVQHPPRTIVYSATAKASPPLPGISSDTDLSQTSDTEPSQMPPMLQRVPSPLPQPPPAPAIAGEDYAHGSSSQSGYNKIVPRAPPEVPATAGDVVMSAVPVMPPLSVVPATAGSQVEGWLAAQDV